MKKISILLIAAAAIGFTSCKKDKQNNPTTTPSSKLLKKITTTENGHITVYTLSYNAAKKLTSVQSNDNSEALSFTYDANGNVTKTEETSDQFHNIYTYAYNNGVPATGTFKSWQHHGGEPDELIEDDQLTYTVANNQVTKIHLNMLQADEQADFTLSYTNGNLTHVQSDGSAGYSASFVYGNKQPVFPKVYNYVLDQAGFALQFFAKNELLSQSFDFPGTALDFTTSTQYTYDADGRVLTSSDGTSTSAYEYE